MFVRNDIKGIHRGEVFVITAGSMFAGKTETLLLHRRRLAIEEEILNLETPRTLRAFKHIIDNRYEKEDIASHDGNKMPALATDSLSEINAIVQRDDVRIVIIDEAQFFNEKTNDGKYLIVQYAMQWVREKRYVIVVGLKSDFKGDPFGPMGDLLAIANDFTFLKSVCVCCGSPATMTQRLIDGKPAYYDDPIVVVGAKKDGYEPRCINCHKIRFREELGQSS